MIFMSLTTLTFGGMSEESANFVGRGKVKIVKAEKFVGMDAVCVIGRLVDGAVAKKMIVHGKENETHVLSVESKYGDGACNKIGAQVVLMIQGIQKDDYPAGTEITLTKSAQEAAKPKGKIIIA